VDRTLKSSLVFRPGKTNIQQFMRVKENLSVVFLGQLGTDGYGALSTVQRRYTTPLFVHILIILYFDGCNTSCGMRAVEFLVQMQIQ
jgi:hypothetical protein